MGRCKKIIIFHYGNFPYGGAAANFVRLFSLSLSSQKNSVEVVLPTGNYYGNILNKKTLKQSKIENVKYQFLGFINHPKNIIGKLIDKIFGVIFPIFYLLKKSLKNEIEFIVLYDTTCFNALIFIFLKYITRKKLVIILPEFYEKPKSGFLSFQILNWYSFFISFKYLIKYSDGFIVLTTYIENQLKDIIKIKKQILILPNLTDPKQFETEYKNTFIENKITIGYTGTPTRKDGILDLIKSFSIIHSKYPYTHLLIIGDLTNGKTLIPELTKYAKGLNVDQDITFTGLVSYSRIPEMLLSCQILALTRPKGVFAEAGFPTKLGEYFSCKKPVLITSVGDIPKYFQNNEQVILVEPENIKSIVEGFERLINNTELNQKIANNGFLWMNQNLNYLSVSTKLDLFFEYLGEI